MISLGWRWMRQAGLATASGSRPASTSTTPRAAAVKVAAVARRLSPIRCGVEEDVGVAVQRMGAGRLGVEHVEADPGQPPGCEGPPNGVGVDEAAAAAVDQHRTRLDPREEGVVD